MKKSLLTCLVIVLLSGVLFAQEAQETYSYTFDGGIGDCVLNGVTLDQAWTATLKALVLIKHQILSAEKESGTISSRRKMPGALGVFNALHKVGVGTRSDTRKDEMPGFDLIFEEREDGIGILATIIEGEGQMPMGKKGSRIFAKKFFDKVTELLYGKIEK